MAEIKKYLEGGMNNSVNYNDFVKNYEMDDEKILSNIQHFISNRVENILLIKIDEDKIFLTKEELKKLPSGVSHYLAYSECRGIKIYVFTTKNGGFKKAIGVFGGSTGRANEYYFDQIINNKKYTNITTKISVKLTDLLDQ